MKSQLVGKYIRDIDGLLKEIDDSIGDSFLEWKGFPNEKMVIFLFGCLYKFFKFVDITVGHEEEGDLDAQAFFSNVKEVLIEFEAYSSSFEKHRHDKNKCNLIICWEHDWKECLKNIDVIELKHFWEMKNK